MCSEITLSIDSISNSLGKLKSDEQMYQKKKKKPKTQNKTKTK